MMKKVKSPVNIPSKYLSRLDINKLRGRLMHLPYSGSGKTKKTIILMAGQHASHERIFSNAQMLSEYGDVFSPDLPGFGGMTSFYKIGRDVSYDNYADYLYSFLKSKKLTKNLTFFAWSFSSQIMTRMFQKYPETASWVSTPIAFVGFAAGDNFDIPKRNKLWIYLLIHTARTKLGAKLINIFAFNRVSLELMMGLFKRTKAKMQSDDTKLANDMIKMEKYLWAVNDTRTHAATTIMEFEEDLTVYGSSKIDLELYNIVTKNDQYFNNKSVEKSFKKIYKTYKPIDIESPVHTPSLVVTKEAVKEVMPKEVLKLLSS